VDSGFDPDSLEVAVGVECRASRGSFAGGTPGGGSIGLWGSGGDEHCGEPGASPRQCADFGLKGRDAEFCAADGSGGRSAQTTGLDDGSETFAGRELADGGGGIRCAEAPDDAAGGGLVDAELCREFSDARFVNTGNL
jgi:hypothetical protein